MSHVQQIEIGDKVRVISYGVTGTVTDRGVVRSQAFGDLEFARISYDTPRATQWGMLYEAHHCLDDLEKI